MLVAYVWVQLRDNTVLVHTNTLTSAVAESNHLEPCKLSIALNARFFCQLALSYIVCTFGWYVTTFLCSEDTFGPACSHVKMSPVLWRIQFWCYWFEKMRRCPELKRSKLYVIELQWLESKAISHTSLRLGVGPYFITHFSVMFGPFAAVWDPWLALCVHWPLEWLLREQTCLP
jgi:hypothetical protein